MNHKYSTYGLCLLIGLLIVGAVTAFGSSDLDLICDTDNKILKRINGNWQCSEQNTETYGELHSNHGAISNILAQNTYYNVTNLTQGQSNNVNLTNDYMNITQTGTYKIDSQFAFSDGANTEFHLALGINGIKNPHCHTERKLGTGGDVGSASFTCIDELTQGDIITIMIENVDNSNSPTIHSINLNIMRLS